MQKHANAIGLLISLAFALGVNESEAGHQHVFYTYAPVLRVTPIMHTVQVPVRHEACGHANEDHAVLQSEYFAGDVRTLDPHLSIGDTIRKDTRLRRQQIHRCPIVEPNERQKRIVGYEVQYRYGHDIFVRRMPYDPGQRVRVRVEVSPSR